MKYVKALDVLPSEIIEIIQEYIDGEFLYVPRKDCNQKAWGEKSGLREDLKVRNKEIYEKYLNGANIKALAKEYYLSDKSIRRIIGNEKQLCS